MSVVWKLFSILYLEMYNKRWQLMVDNVEENSEYRATRPMTEKSKKIIDTDSMA